MGQDDRIEVDLNYIFRMPLVEPEIRELWQPGELDRTKVRVVGLEELLVGKLSPSWTVALRGMFGMWRISQLKR